MTIKAIETVYNGYKFRSRLEARWAVFLDHLRLSYRYEEQGFELPSGWYLPDFALQGWSRPTYLEVKGKPPGGRELGLASELARKAEACVYIAYGECWLPTKHTTGVYGWSKQGGQPTDTYLKNCAACGYVEFSSRPLSECKDCGGIVSLTGERLKKAYTAARQARFEHGASGA